MFSPVIQIGMSAAMYPGAMAEGRRHNILPASRSLEDFGPQEEWPKLANQISSIMSGEKADTYRCTTNDDYTFKYTFDNPLSYKSFCFSVHFISLSDVIFNVQLGISDGRYSTWSHHQFSNKWKRVFVAHDFPQRPNELTILIAIQLSDHFKNLKDVEFAVAVMCVEEGLFPTSPIPALQYRDGERYSISLDKVGSIRRGLEGHILLIYTPYWFPDQLSQDRKYTIFAGFGKNGDQLFELSHDPRSRGLLTLEIDGFGSFVSHIPVPQSGPYAVSLDWNQANTEVSVDGVQHIICPLSIPIKECERLHFASSPKDEENSLFCSIQILKIYEYSIRHGELRNLLYLLSPEKFGRYNAEFQLKLVENLILYESRIKEAYAIVDKILKWCTLAREIPNARLEIDFRNQLYTSLKMEDFNPYREDENSNGRTDIVVPIVKEEGDVFNLRVETKMWGGTGYRNVPSQPIKYMDETETFGIYVMIAENANEEIRRKFVQFASNNKEFSNCGIIGDNPLSKELPFHFFSVHKNDIQGNTKIILCILCSVSNNS